MFALERLEEMRVGEMREISIAENDKDSIKWYDDKWLLQNGVKIACNMWLHLFTQHYASSKSIILWLSPQPPRARS